jgi:hypothetical protein
MNLVKDESCEFLAGSYIILNRWNKYFSQLLNVPNVIQHNRWYTEVDIDIAKLKNTNNQVIIEFWQNRFKQEVKYYCLWSRDSLALLLGVYCFTN